MEIGDKKISRSKWNQPAMYSSMAPAEIEADIPLHLIAEILKLDANLKLI